MSEPDILYPAIFIFIMLLIGLGLTVAEFHRVQKSTRVAGRKQADDTGFQSEETRDRIPKTWGI